MATNTSQEFDQVIGVCKTLFLKKTKDYGTAWRILRPSSITDQIFIKAQRIRTLEEKKVSKVGEDITSEYIGIVNYCIIAMVQLELTESDPNEMEVEVVESLFDKRVTETKDLMFAITNVLLTKLVRETVNKVIEIKSVKKSFLLNSSIKSIL